MKCSTEAVEAMAKIVVKEMKQMGLAGEDIRGVETGIREILRAVGAQALGQYLERQDEDIRKEEVICGCVQEMEYRFKREATILSVFGRVHYRRWYHLCSACHGVTPFQWTHGSLRVIGYEPAGLRTGWVKDSRWLSVVDADCTSLR